MYNIEFGVECYRACSTAGLPTPNVSNIAIDKNDIKWIASDAGLIKFDGTTWTVYNSQNLRYVRAHCIGC